MSTLLTKIAADFSTQLSSALSVGGTSATLLSQTDDDGNTIPDGNYAFTLDGASSNKEHIRCVKTGLNLTSIQSLSRQGALTSGVVRAHRVGTSVVITDWAQLKYLTDLLSGTTDLDSSDPLKYDGTATITNDAHLATKKYVDDTAIAGAPKATDSVYGITKLSVAAVSPTDPIAVGTNDTRMPTQGENDALVGTSGTPGASNKYVTNDDTSDAAVTNKVIRATGIKVPALDGSLLKGIPYLFGDGSDGNVTISVNTTLTSDMYYNNLTINGGVTLNTGGYRIYGKGTLTNNGTIANNGSAGTSSVVGAGAVGVTLGGGKNGGSGGGIGVAAVARGGCGGGGGGVVWISFHTISVQGTIEAKGGNGGNGSTPGGSVTTEVGAVGVSSSLTLLSSGTGGAGGNSASANGGSGGSVTTSKTNRKNLFALVNFVDIMAGTSLTGGAGGGGGGETSGGTIGAGGGGGGQGGVIFTIYNTLTTSGTLTVTGGTGGSAAGTGGTTGTTGSSGASISIQV